MTTHLLQGPGWAYSELVARVYELDKPAGTSFGDVEFYLQRLAGVTGPVLEPTVGNGRFLVPLLQQGWQVRGYDTSEHMLRICRDTCAGAGLPAPVFAADMLTYREPATYAAVVVPVGSVILLPDREAALRALRNFHDSLVPGGRLIVAVPTPSMDAGPGKLRHWVDGAELISLQTMHVEIDSAQQNITQWLRYERWREGALVATHLQLFRLLWFGLREFDQLLRSPGFAEVTVCADYDQDRAPGPGNRMWTFEAVRP